MTKTFWLSFFWDTVWTPDVRDRWAATR